MLDISKGFDQLRKVSELHIVAVKNEVKELLWCIDRTTESASIHCVNLETTQSIFSTTANSINKADCHHAIPKSYIYEANAAIMKSQEFGELCGQFKIEKLARLSHLFTTDQLIDFPGRVFKVIQILEYKPKILKRHLNKQSRSIITRNFPLASAQLKTKFAIKEDELNFAIFTTLNSGERVLIDAERVN